MERGREGRKEIKFLAREWQLTAGMGKSGDHGEVDSDIGLPPFESFIICGTLGKMLALSRDHCSLCKMGEIQPYVCMKVQQTKVNKVLVLHPTHEQCLLNVFYQYLFINCMFYSKFCIKNFTGINFKGSLCGGSY